MPILKNPKHERFAIALVACNSQQRAAIDAGYSPATAKQMGYTLARRPDIAARLEELRKVQWQAMQMENEEILARLAAAARADIRKLYRVDGTMKAPHEMTFEEAAMITGIEHDERKDKKGQPVVITRKVKFRDPVPALRLLAQHRKLIGSDADEALSNIAAAFADRMAAARARRRQHAK
jgi:phage terminase small subunit